MTEIYISHTSQIIARVNNSRTIYIVNDVQQFLQCVTQEDTDCQKSRTYSNPHLCDHINFNKNPHPAVY